MLMERELRLISGKGCYVDDMELPNMAYCVFVGSPHAHARLRRIDVDKAIKKEGVIKVITGKDLVELMDPLPPRYILLMSIK
jgi:carbon-monoxide dehydrogenase large subunit